MVRVFGSDLRTRLAMVVSSCGGGGGAVAVAVAVRL